MKIFFLILINGLITINTAEKPEATPLDLKPIILQMFTDSKKEILGPKERMYLLPTDDGDTVIVFKEENQPNFVRWPLSPEVEDDCKERIKDYFNKFPDECRLKALLAGGGAFSIRVGRNKGHNLHCLTVYYDKSAFVAACHIFFRRSSEEDVACSHESALVTLFKEMSRTLPTWVEIGYDWLHEILRMTVHGEQLNPKNDLTSSDEVVLKWLFFTLTEPRVTKLAESCQEAALEMTGQTEPKASVVFLLEHKETLEGDLTYAFMAPRPEDVFTLIFLFPEAGKGCCFTKSLKQAVSSTASYTFPFCDKTDTRYGVVLMLEYVVHPGIHSIDGTTVTELTAVNNTHYRMDDTKNARIRAILLYKTVLKEETNRAISHARGVWIAFTMFSIGITAHALYNIRKINFLK